MAKCFELEWVFDGLRDDASFSTRHMFGGKAAYCRGKMIFCIAEDKKSSEWFGLLLPTEREHHASLRAAFPALTPHAILGKWLYLPITCDDFEEIVGKLTRLALKDDIRIGVFPKPRIRRG